MTQTDQALDVRRIDPGSISADPDNPRSKLRDLDELAASVKLHGVLEPITVRPDRSANGSGPRWIVVRGHRRHAAALKAKVDLIPCVVDWSEDAKLRAQHRLVENLQRDDLSATEQAKGVQQLLDLGMSEEEVAAGLSVAAEHVAAAKRIQSSKTLAKAGPKVAEMSFEMAAGIAEFEDSPKIAKELLATAERNPEDFSYDLERFRQERVEQRLIDEKSAEMKAAGYRILENARDWLGPDRATQVAVGMLCRDASVKGKLTTAQHKGCPGRAVHIRTDYSGQLLVTEYCTDWKANGHVPATSGSRASSTSGPTKELTPAEQKEADKATQERRIHLACIKAGRAAEVVRRRFVSDLLARSDAPKGALAFAVPILMLNHIDDAASMFEDLVMTKAAKTGRRSMGVHDVQGAYVQALTEKQLPLALVARVAAHLEARWEPNSWKSAYTIDQRKAYLRFLISCGYEPSLIERVQLGEAKPAAVLAEAERIKAAAKA